MKEILTVNNVKKQYKVGEVILPVLRGISFGLYEGELVVILGPSGSGKSTVLNMIGGIDSPSEGQIFYNNKDIGAISDRELTKYRSNAIGFVFQFYNLLQNLTARENIEIAAGLSNDPLDTDTLLEEIGLTDHARHFPAQLSGGQQQRIAVARALAAKPQFILADEPTANLDSKSAENLLDIMEKLNQEEGITFLFSTHDSRVMQRAKRVVTLEDGKIKN